MLADWGAAAASLLLPGGGAALRAHAVQVAAHNMTLATARAAQSATVPLSIEQRAAAADQRADVATRRAAYHDWERFAVARRGARRHTADARVITEQRLNLQRAKEHAHWLKHEGHALWLERERAGGGASYPLPPPRLGGSGGSDVDLNL
jgi:hypothetical protein